MLIFSSNGKKDANARGEPSVFLAGPTLRDQDRPHHKDWREEALSFFKDRKFMGHVYVPSPYAGDFSVQIDWEVYHLEKTGCILFWVPRDMKMLPGLTTNIEFGEYLRSGKIVLGAPEEAERMDYMIYRAEKYGIPISRTLETTVDNAIKLADQRAKASRTA